MLLIGLVSAIGTLFTVTRSVAADLITVDGAKLQTMMADGKPMVIVDVREPELFAKGHIKKAINIPYDSAASQFPWSDRKPTNRKGVSAGAGAVSGGRAR
jgi:3-mercaptopyruvate sulfurtransferase SseA